MSIILTDRDQGPALDTGHFYKKFFFFLEEREKISEHIMRIDKESTVRGCPRFDKKDEKMILGCK